MLTWMQQKHKFGFGTIGICTVTELTLADGSRLAKQYAIWPRELHEDLTCLAFIQSLLTVAKILDFNHKDFVTCVESLSMGK